MPRQPINGLANARADLNPKLRKTTGMKIDSAEDAEAGVEAPWMDYNVPRQKLTRRSSESLIAVRQGEERICES
jgi:hypothetical protein